MSDKKHILFLHDTLTHFSTAKIIPPTAATSSVHSTTSMLTIVSLKPIVLTTIHHSTQQPPKSVPRLLELPTTPPVHTTYKATQFKCSWRFFAKQRKLTILRIQISKMTSTILLQHIALYPTQPQLLHQPFSLILSQLQLTVPLTRRPITMFEIMVSDQHLLVQ